MVVFNVFLTKIPGWRGSYRGKTCRYSLAQARQFLTLNVTSPPSIDAVRKNYSITGVGVAKQRKRHCEAKGLCR
jgi:hypothetical protein